MAQNPSPEHKRLVANLINHFIKNLGLNIISASFEGFPEPTKFGRHEPDIVAIDQNGLIHIAEAKTSNDIFNQTSKEQFIDFSNRVMKSNGKPVIFHLIVYKEDETNLLSALTQLNLGYKVGGLIRIWTLN